jgi:hypothetical protein
MLTMGTIMSRLSHPENPAFAKMNQNGTMINAAKTSITNGPNGHIDIPDIVIIGIFDIISGMACLLH